MAQRTLSQTIQDTSNLMERVRREGVTDASGRVLRAPESQAIRQLGQQSGDPLASFEKTQQVAQETPIQKFNLILMDMLKKYQQLGTGKFREAELAGREQQIRALRETPSSLIGAPPSLQRDVREAEGKVFEPEITGAKEMRQTFQEKLDSFEKILKAAKEYGGEIMKYIKPDEATIKATEAQIRSGSVPSADVMEKVGKYLPTDVWSDWAEANRKGTQDQLTLYQQEQQNLRKTQIFNQIVDKYQKSPLIVAADRAASTLNLIPQLKVNPGARENQLIAIYQFIQILDNYQSAVREGEIGLLTGASSLRERVETSIQKLNEGKAVNSQVVLDIAKGMETLVNSIRTSAQAKEKQFEAQSNTAGVGEMWKNYRGQFESTFESGQNMVEKGGRKYKVIPD